MICYRSDGLCSPSIGKRQKTRMRREDFSLHTVGHTPSPIHGFPLPRGMSYKVEIKPDLCCESDPEVHSFAGALRLRHLSSVRWTRPIKCPGKFFILTLQGRDKLLPEYPAGMSHVPLLGWRISNLTPAVQKLVCSYERWHRVKNEFLTKSSLTEIKTSAAAREHPRSMTAFFSNRILIGEFIRAS